MKISTMSAGDRRALMFGAAIIVPSLFFVFAVKPYRAALAGVQQQLAVERDALARERAAVSASKRNPQMQHVADSAMQAMAPRLFAGRDDVMASAEVATYLGDIARASHVWLQDASTRPATALDGGVRALHVEIRGESDLRGILEFVTSLESGAKFIRVQRLDVFVAARTAPTSPGAETLALSASIVGYAIPDQAASGARVANGADAVAEGGTMSDREWVSTERRPRRDRRARGIRWCSRSGRSCTRSASSRCPESRRAAVLGERRAGRDGAAARRSDVAAAVDADPFAADRNAPERRYRAPGEESDDAAPQVAPSPSPWCSARPSSDGAHGFATVQLGDGAATIVHGRRQDRRIHRQVHRARARRVHDAVREEARHTRAQAMTLISMRHLRVALLAAAAAVATRRAARKARPSAPPADTTAGAPRRSTRASFGRRPMASCSTFRSRNCASCSGAIAEAGGLNVTFANLPSTKVTLRMGQQVTKAEALDVLRGVVRGERTEDDGRSVADPDRGHARRSRRSSRRSSR